MKLFEIKKFDFLEYNKNVVSNCNNNITVPENYSGFNIFFQIEINNSEILNSFRNKKNVEIIDNSLQYNCLCCNNEIVISTYDFVERNSQKEKFVTNISNIIDTLNLWEIE